MKRSRFTEEQIIGILREQETGVPVADLCRKHGLSSPTFYKWKAKFGGMDVSGRARDACGIVVAGRRGDRVRVLADWTAKGLSPEAWADRVRRGWRRWRRS